MQYLSDRTDLSGQVVLLRLDLNVPVDQHSNVSDTTRIDRAYETVQHLHRSGAKTLIISHFGRPKGEAKPEYSLSFLPETLIQQWDLTVGFVPECIGEPVSQAVQAMQDGDVVLLENLRFHAGEETNDPEFAQALTHSATLYVNDAFSVSHRAHASTVGVVPLLPAVAGFQMQKECEALNAALTKPERPVAA